MEHLKLDLRDIVFKLRSGDYPEALSMFNLFLSALTEGLNSGEISVDINKLTYSLETLFMMQKNEDYIAMADILEYEIIELI